MITALEKISETNYYIKFYGLNSQYFMDYGLAEIHIDPEDRDHFVVAVRTSGVTEETPLSDLN